MNSEAHRVGISQVKSRLSPGNSGYCVCRFMWSVFPMLLASDNDDDDEKKEEDADLVACLCHACIAVLWLICGFTVFMADKVSRCLWVLPLPLLAGTHSAWREQRGVDRLPK